MPQNDCLTGNAWRHSSLLLALFEALFEDSQTDDLLNLAVVGLVQGYCVVMTATSMMLPQEPWQVDTVACQDLAAIGTSTSFSVCLGVMVDIGARESVQHHPSTTSTSFIGISLKGSPERCRFLFFRFFSAFFPFSSVFFHFLPFFPFLLFFFSGFDFFRFFRFLPFFYFLQICRSCMSQQHDP